MLQQAERDLPLGYALQAKVQLGAGELPKAIELLVRCARDTDSDCMEVRHAIVKHAMGKLWQPGRYWTRDEGYQTCLVDGCSPGDCSDATKAGLSCMRYFCARICLRDEGFAGQCRHPKVEASPASECTKAWWSCDATCRKL